jgi:hypothetical protein
VSVTGGHDEAADRASAASSLASPRPRLRAATIAVGVATALSGVDAAGAIAAYAQNEHAIDEDPAGSSSPLGALGISQDALDRLNTVSDVAHVAILASVVSLVIAAVFVLRWQLLAVRNQRALRVVPPRYSPAAAGWSWVVPIWAFFGPKKAYNDLWRVAEPADERIPGQSWVDRAVPGLFAAWWTAWILGGLLGTASYRTPTDTLGGNATSWALEAGSGLMLMVAGVLFIAVLARITARHDEMRLTVGAEVVA